MGPDQEPPPPPAALPPALAGHAAANGPPGPGAVLPERIGLVAGGGVFPLYVARRAASLGIRVYAVGLRHAAPRELLDVCARVRFLGLGRLGAALRFFRSCGVEEVTLAGWVRKESLYRPWRILSLLPDWRLLRLWYRRVRNRQDATLLAAVADEFEREGLRVAHSTRYCPELLAEEGVLTRRHPTASQARDIAFGWRVAKRMADLDVGQSVVVCEASTIAVEGIEGTDRNIERAGQLHRRGGLVVVKVAKEGHDMRFDVPAIGPGTIAAMQAAKGAVLAIEAGRTMILEREETIASADRLGLVIVALREPPGTADPASRPGA